MGQGACPPPLRSIPFHPLPWVGTPSQTTIPGCSKAGTYPPLSVGVRPNRVQRPTDMSRELSTVTTAASARPHLDFTMSIFPGKQHPAHHPVPPPAMGHLPLSQALDTSRMAKHLQLGKCITRNNTTLDTRGNQQESDKQLLIGMALRDSSG
uniref:Uncharacterized protein n=1 Tax=Malurus cyaneus samueli TaxID=2593467 RepID=A0A8C5X9H5_9PASS